MGTVIKKQATQEILTIISHKTLPITLQAIVDNYLDGVGEKTAIMVAQEIADALGFSHSYYSSEIASTLLKYQPE